MYIHTYVHTQTSTPRFHWAVPEPILCPDIAAMTEVEERFVNDVQYARNKGVDLRELLRVLSARKGEV